MSGINNKIWTDNEIKILKDNYSKNGILRCKSLIDRSIIAIRKKANYLGLTKIYHKEIYNIENIKCVVANSKSLTDILNKLNLRTAGGNFNTIKKYIKEYDINIEHFETVKERNKNIINVDEYFCTNSKVSRSTIKRYILKNDLLKYVCSLCGQDDSWFGKKLVLILDHINGVNNDNTLSNLRFVCPNCNSTLDTHCGKNIKK